MKAGQLQAAVSTAPAGTGELNLEGGSTSVVGGSSGGGVGSTDADWKVLLERTEGGKADEAYLKNLIAKEEKFGMWMTNLVSCPDLKSLGWIPSFESCRLIRDAL